MKKQRDGILELSGMAEADLAAFIFVNCSDTESAEVCRERLELEILEIWDRELQDFGMQAEADGGGGDDEYPMPTISPFWLYRVLLSRAAKETASLSDEEYANLAKDYTESALKYRRENWADIKNGEKPALPPPLPLPRRRKRR